MSKTIKYWGFAVNFTYFLAFFGICSTIVNMKTKKTSKTPTPTLSKADKDMMDELDYEYKKNHKPYDRFERHWDEA